MEALRITLHWASERLHISELDLIQLLQYQYGDAVSELHSQLQDILWDLESVCRTRRFGEPFTAVEYPIDRIEDLMITLERW
jgi:hypothetical protein